MNFVFEDLENFLNYIDGPDTVSSGLRRFAPSPTAVTVIHRTQMASKFSMENKPRPYIIAAGVNHSPNDWTGYSLAIGNNKTTAFSNINKKQLKDVQQGKAMLLFDQSLEGYHAPWLWEYFHKECLDYNINPEAVIHITGNSLCDKQYDKWATDNNISNRMTAIPYVHFEADVYKQSIWNHIDISVDKHLEYKKTNEIKDFNCLQKRLRAHRIWFYIRMFEEELLKNGLVSMNPFNTSTVYFEDRIVPKSRADAANSILPLLVHGKNNNEFDDGYYIKRVQDQVCLDSWVTIISEASFSDLDQQLFLSEKVFKPIACLHPFIILGNKGSLKELRDMGYKTFDGFIDESYDNLSTFERYDAIVESIKKIINIENKVKWYNSMRPILEHNYETLKKNSTTINPAFIKLERAYKKYFKLGKYKNV
jgi:L-rhamnose mutarotase